MLPSEWTLREYVHCVDLEGEEAGKLHIYCPLPPISILKHSLQHLGVEEGSQQHCGAGGGNMGKGGSPGSRGNLHHT